MDSIKTTSFTLTTVVAGLALWLTPNPEWETVPIIDRIETKQVLAVQHKHEIPIYFEPLQSTVETFPEPRPDKHDTPVISAAKMPASKAGEWLLILYPELARIIDLENLSPDMALSKLLPMLSDSDPVIRLAVLESLADMSHPAHSSVLAAALDDPVLQIRMAALEALAIRDDDSAWAYIEPYLFDENADVRVAAIEALAELESEQAIHSLVGLLYDQDSLVRHHAVNALGEIGGESVNQYLEQLRYDPNKSIQANATAILAGN